MLGKGKKEFLEKKTLTLERVNVGVVLPPLAVSTGDAL